MTMGKSTKANLHYTKNMESETLQEGGVEMKITSGTFLNNEKIPSKYTCDGENINPQLSIYGVPEDAKSIVLIVDDPDAPDGAAVIGYIG